MSTDTLYSSERFLLDNPIDLISLDKWQKTVNLLARVFNAPASFLVQYTPKGFQVTIASKQVSNPYPPGVVIAPDTNIFCRRIVETRSDLYVPDAKIDPCWETNPEVQKDGFSSYLGVPVFWPDGSCFGTFCVMDRAKTDYQASYFELIHQLKEIIEADLALLDIYGELKQLAHLDELCHINNRRGFKGLARQRMKLAQRNESRLALLYIDVDDFKGINDGHGHSVGDEVLKLLAGIIKQSVRGSDVVGRIGGDEFVVLLMCQNDEDVIATETRIMQGLDNAMLDSHLPEVSVTIGHKIADQDVRLDVLLAQADEDMFRRKRDKQAL
ncbi:sensor domain-containing diguanylate cyclase [Shewanella sp. cp20]|uniref:sensor domain-containing diguanylate cyclase n=1 Tax=Shewanella sp. cp20 TaxID=1521167 RepID=UPI0005A14321|nr:sensor domain-containing diguanylate cyclase [Shewanella sp. cp20]KIO36800.1 diguanylate cyclase [Shewanella sp. cp20]